MQEFLPILQHCRLFASMTIAEISAMLPCLQATCKHYDKGSYLFHAGDLCTQMGIVLTGRLLLQQEDAWGNCHLLGQILPSELFAESYACNPQVPFGISAMAVEPSTVLWFDIHRVLGTCPTACEHHTAIIRNLLAVLAQKNLHFSEKLRHIGQRTTAQKLLSYLSAESFKQQSATFAISFSRQQLADYLAVERTAMCAALSSLQKQGVLRYHKNQFTLLQSDR